MAWSDTLLSGSNVLCGVLSSPLLFCAITFAAWGGRSRQFESMANRPTVHYSNGSRRDDVTKTNDLMFNTP